MVCSKLLGHARFALVPPAVASEPVARDGGCPCPFWDGTRGAADVGVGDRGHIYCAGENGEDGASRASESPGVPEQSNLSFVSGAGYVVGLQLVGVPWAGETETVSSQGMDASPRTHLTTHRQRHGGRIQISTQRPLGERANRIEVVAWRMRGISCLTGTLDSERYFWCLPSADRPRRCATFT